MSPLTFTVYGPPRGKQRPRLGKGGRVYTPRTTRAYESSVAWAATAARPRSWSQSGPMRLRVSAFFADDRRRDVDNVLKAVMDALNGVLYADDSQVLGAQVVKAIDRCNPRTEVQVWRAADKLTLVACGAVE